MTFLLQVDYWQYIFTFLDRAPRNARSFRQLLEVYIVPQLTFQLSIFQPRCVSFDFFFVKATQDILKIS